MAAHYITHIRPPSSLCSVLIRDGGIDLPSQFIPGYFPTTVIREHLNFIICQVYACHRQGNPRPFDALFDGVRRMAQFDFKRDALRKDDLLYKHINNRRQICAKRLQDGSRFLPLLKLSSRISNSNSQLFFQQFLRRHLS